MRVLLDQVRVVASDDEREELVRALVFGEGPRMVSFLNQHGFNLAYSDRATWDALVTSDVLLRDGVGIEIAVKALSRPAGVNCNGTDLIPEILRAAPGRSVAVFGTREPWLSAGVEAIADLGVDVVVSRDGFRDDESYLDDVRDHRPDIVILGLGMPRQELLAVKIKHGVAHRCLIVSGGAIIDFLGGRYPRAPLWMQHLRLEWAFRLRQEPKRLFRRYILGGGAFAFRMLQIWRASAQRV